MNAPMLFLRLLLTLCFTVLVAIPALAACPGSDPCETIYVYKFQSWPTIMQDAAGRSLLSLREANASNETAFRQGLPSMGKGTALAIRYQVTRITSTPNGYCNCNLELNNVGCGGGITLDKLKKCTRSCRYNNAQCVVAGVDVKDGGGQWYAFPDATRHTGAVGQVWQKNAHGVGPNNRDWSENSRVIKRADCIAKEMSKSSPPTLDSLFDSDNPCASVSDQTLAGEERKK